MGKLTKKQVVAIFLRDIMPVVQRVYEPQGIPDWPARAEAWNNFIDTLCKDGDISEHQYNTWTSPTIVG